MLRRQRKKYSLVECIEHEVCCYCCQEITSEVEEEHTKTQEELKQERRIITLETAVKSNESKDVLEALQEVEEKIKKNEIAVSTLKFETKKQKSEVPSQRILPPNDPTKRRKARRGGDAVRIRRRAKEEKA